MVKKKSRNAKKGRNLSRQRSLKKNKINDLKIDENPLSPTSVIQSDEDLTAGKLMPDTPLNDEVEPEAVSEDSQVEPEKVEVQPDPVNENELEEDPPTLEIQAEATSERGNVEESTTSALVKVEPVADADAEAETIELENAAELPTPTEEAEAELPVDSESAGEISLEVEEKCVKNVDEGEPKIGEPESQCQPSHNEDPVLEEFGDDIKQEEKLLIQGEALIQPASDEKELSLTEPMEKEANDGSQGCDCNSCVVL